MSFIYIMTEIHTLQTLNSKKIKFTKTAIPKKGEFPKKALYYESIKYIKKLNKASPHWSMCPLILEPGQKCGAKALKNDYGDEILPPILYAATHAKDKQWDEDKLRMWISPLEDSSGTKHSPMVDQRDYGLGVLIGRGVGVLDFDCEKDWNWFVNTFKPDLNLYPIVQGSGHHGCDCPSADHKTYHLYFQKDDFWVNQTWGTNVIYEDYEVNDKRRMIDYLRNHDNGTPHVVALPSGNKKKKWLKQPDTLQTLDPHITSHFKDAWRQNADKKIAKKVGNNKYLELFKIIPPTHVQQSKFIRMIIELKGQRVDDSIIVQESFKLRRTDLDRVGPGSREYTKEEHKEWVNGLIRLYDPQTDRMCVKTIVQLAQDTMPEESASIHRKDLDVLGTEFNIQKVKDIERYESDPNIRMHKVQRYYNHFCIITSCDGISNEPRRLLYNRIGNRTAIRTFKTCREFLQGHDTKIVLSNTKSESAAKWWMENYQRYDQCIYKPVGATEGKHNQDPRIFNSFTGYKMQYDPNYSNESFDKRGDTIHHHLSKVMCWDEENPKSMDVYDFLRKWMYTHICLGKRPNVGLVFYSPELGTGKSFFSRCYADRVVGRALTYQVSRFGSLVNDRFTDGYENKSLMCIEELPENSYKNKAGWDFFKTFISDDDQESRRMYCGADTTTIHCPVIMNTNHVYAVDGDAASRRLLCVRVNPKYHHDTTYFNRLWACDNDESWKNYFHRYIINKYHEFGEVDISPNENTIPMTKYKRNLMSRSVDSVVIFLGYWLKLMNKGTSEEPDWTGCVGKSWHIEAMFGSYKSFCVRKHHECYIKTTYEFKKKLQDRFEMTMTEIEVELDSPQAVETLKPRKDVACMNRDNKGHFLVFTEKLLKRLWEHTKKKTRQTDKIIEVSQQIYNACQFTLEPLEPQQGFLTDSEDELDQ